MLSCVHIGISCTDLNYDNYLAGKIMFEQNNILFVQDNMPLHNMTILFEYENKGSIIF